MRYWRTDRLTGITIKWNHILILHNFIMNIYLEYVTYWYVNPLMCKIFICLIIVVFPDSPVPNNRIFFVSLNRLVYLFASSSSSDWRVFLFPHTIVEATESHKLETWLQCKRIFLLTMETLNQIDKRYVNNVQYQSILFWIERIHYFHKDFILRNTIHLKIILY